jgi:hypothetical protein
MAVSRAAEIELSVIRGCGQEFAAGPQATPMGRVRGARVLFNGNPSGGSAIILVGDARDQLNDIPGRV